MTNPNPWKTLLLWAIAALAILCLQYLTVSNVDFGPFAHDTNPYPGPIVWLVREASPITLLPLGPLAHYNVRTGGTKWTHAMFRGIYRFHDYRANNLCFAGVNTVSWLLAGGLVRWFFRRARRRQPGARV